MRKLSGYCVFLWLISVALFCACAGNDGQQDSGDQGQAQAVAQMADGAQSDGEVQVVQDASSDMDEAGPAPEVLKRALLVDFDMQPEVSWAPAIDMLESLGYQVSYRRFYPHLTAEDVGADEEEGLRHALILVAAGGGPATSTEMMRVDDETNLTAYVQTGGSLVLFTRHGWSDRYLGDSEWLHMNRILQRLDVGLRIERATMMGDVFVNEGGGAPLHQANDWSYPGSLEWMLALPLAYPASDLVHTAQLPGPFAPGWVPLISCDSSQASVLARVHDQALIWWHHGEDNNVWLTDEAEIIAAMAPAGAGLVALLPRQLVNVLQSSFHMSDKPVLDLGLLDASRSNLAGFLETIVRHSEDPSLHSPQGCWSGKVPLSAATAPGLEAVGDGPAESVSTPPSMLPVPETPPTAPDWAAASLAEQSQETSLPSWFSEGGARLLYGTLSPDPSLLTGLEEAAMAGCDSMVLSMDSSWLFLEANDEASDSPPWTAVADLAETLNLKYFLGVFFNTAELHAIVAADGSARGPLGQVAGLPSPLHPQVWDDVLRPLVLGAAKAAAKHGGIGGISIDMELYGANVLWYEQGLAFDELSWTHVTGRLAEHDAALGEEAQGQGLNTRMAWLLAHGLVGFAYRVLEEEIASRADVLRQEARALAPDLEIAIYMPVAVNHWFYRGLFRGFGSAERPALLLSYDLATDALRASLQEEGIHLRMLAGILGVRFTPSDLGISIYQAASRADGYWLFQLSDFPADDTGSMPGHGLPSLYWSAIKTAHEELMARTPSD